MLEHELQSLTRHSHQLQALRRESTGLWTDDRAHTLALHNLNPHQQRDEALRSALADQLTALHEAKAHRARAEQYALDAEHRSARVRERLESAQADTSAAWRACD